MEVETVKPVETVEVVEDAWKIRLKQIEVNGKNLFDEAKSFWQSPDGKKAVLESRRPARETRDI